MAESQEARRIAEELAQYEQVYIIKGTVYGRMRESEYVLGYEFASEPKLLAAFIALSRAYLTEQDELRERVKSANISDAARNYILTEDPPEPRYIFVEGDARCGAVHTEAKAVCLLPRGHEGDHRNTQGYWRPREGEFEAEAPERGER